MDIEEIRNNAPEMNNLIENLRKTHPMDLINDVKFHKSRKRYEGRKKGSKFSNFKLSLNLNCND